jgi:hypothetical protein
MRHWIFASSLPPVLIGVTACFHDVGRVSFAEEGQRQATFNLAPGEVRFAADVEVKDADRAKARFDVDLLQGGQLAAQAACDPLKLGDRKACTYRFGNGDFRCNVVMDCRAHLATGGPTVIRVRLSVAEKPADFTLHRADLIVGQ